MTKFVNIILLFGIISNFALVLIFRFGLDRAYAKKFDEYVNQSNEKLVQLTELTLNHVRTSIVSNYLQNVSGNYMNTVDGTNVSQSIFYETKESLNYHYFEVDGNTFARIGVVNLSVSSPFPRGGCITAIYPDCIIVNNHYLFPNSNQPQVYGISPSQSPFSQSSLSSSSEINKQLLKGSKNE